MLLIVILGAFEALAVVGAIWLATVNAPLWAVVILMAIAMVLMVLVIREAIRTRPQPPISPYTN
jgi:hypothetical protein